MSIGLPESAVIVSLVGAIASIVNTWMISRGRKAIDVLEKNTNSIKDELVRVTGESEHAKGVIQGVASAAEKKGE